MRTRRQTVVLAMALGVMMPAVSRAALVASDNAANAAYSSGWSNGSNGGSGFQPWIGSDPLGTIGTNGNSINGSTIATSGKNWQVNNDGGGVFATRPFTADSGSGIGSLNVGQSISLDFLGGWGSSASVGFSYADATGTARFTFQQANKWPSGDFYRIDDSGSQFVAGADAGVGAHTVFTLVTADRYSLTVTTGVGGSSPVVNTYTGTLAGTAGAGIDRVQLANSGVNCSWGGNWRYDFNSLAISNVPEPTSLALVVMGGISLLDRRRHA